MTVEEAEKLTEKELQSFPLFRQVRAYLRSEMKIDHDTAHRHAELFMRYWWLTIDNDKMEEGTVIPSYRRYRI
jgi:hypothetical protein